MLCGQPRNVVWITEDLGISWTVAKAGDALGNNGISVSQRRCHVICGPLASIRATRNGGKAWWPQHQSGSRVAVLNLASNQQLGRMGFDDVRRSRSEKRTTAISRSARTMLRGTIQPSPGSCIAFRSGS